MRCFSLSASAHLQPPLRTTLKHTGTMRHCVHTHHDAPNQAVVPMWFDRLGTGQGRHATAASHAPDTYVHVWEEHAPQKSAANWIAGSERRASTTAPKRLKRCPGPLSPIWDRRGRYCRVHSSRTKKCGQRCSNQRVTRMVRASH
jgi:hypothetical protein